MTARFISDWHDGWEFHVRVVTDTPTVPAPPPALSRGSEAGAGTPPH